MTNDLKLKKLLKTLASRHNGDHMNGPPKSLGTILS